ncbi:glycerol-3-phosphate ABC transporter ATP-binding protein [Asanoa ishikariensis]|uniref:Carbohydrate ABC transporter ATP-binding protein, CUT1 family n=1 Tax=Asanoa ishikariensis TaxID=137265 RepID=A0A1H3UPB2_9ACTN|nr:sn-glycerol-3-phosphate ABC transporter ATP-binding protein UgpC [Asanoa ishikariensis]GIF69126.1 glycerol-3-phosphate ABC transporter ATP-binding protein [Asanoa ishikariensis]SDZ64224.1 carbohydrate ABC transporter ATP-binding protein, CUT1 family [Asanoa ishikariensis]
MAEVILDRVNKQYENGFHAVKDLDLDIADGEFLVLVGPSGCGKSTALRMVAGLEDITSGTLKIGDRVVNTLSPRDRDIAMVFQSYALYPHMTVADNISYGLKIRRMEKAEIDRRVKKAAEMLELGALLDRRPKQLSGGQRQRVAMGRAIVREPQVFLMDEPLSNLDAKLRVQMRAEIAQVQHDLNVTTIYVTHDQTEAMTMGDRVALMKAGVLQQVGNPQFLYDNPDNIFVAGFIGSPPMNMALAQVERDGDDLVVVLGRSRLPLPAAARSERPGLDAYAGRQVAVGIRSEDMEDARLVRGADERSRLRATVSLIEALGSQIMVHFLLDAPRVVTEDTKLLDKDAHAEEAPKHDATKFVASFAPRSRVRAGDEVEVVVDTERMHFFDPTTGDAIR